MSDTSLQLFPPIARQQVFTDHSVANILAPETAERQTKPVQRATSWPPGDEPRKPVVSVSSPPGFDRRASLCFDDFGDDSILDRTAIQQIESSSSLTVFHHVDQMTTACQSGSYLDQPWRTDRKNFEIEVCRKSFFLIPTSSHSLCFISTPIPNATNFRSRSRQTFKLTSSFVPIVASHNL